MSKIDLKQLIWILGDQSMISKYHKPHPIKLKENQL